MENLVSTITEVFNLWWKKGKTWLCEDSRVLFWFLLSHSKTALLRGVEVFGKWWGSCKHIHKVILYLPLIKWGKLYHLRHEPQYPVPMGSGEISLVIPCARATWPLAQGVGHQTYWIPHMHGVPDLALGWPRVHGTIGWATFICGGGVFTGPFFHLEP